MVIFWLLAIRAAGTIFVFVLAAAAVIAACGALGAVADFLSDDEPEAEQDEDEEVEVDRLPPEWGRTLCVTFLGGPFVAVIVDRAFHRFETFDLLTWLLPFLGLALGVGLLARRWAFSRSAAAGFALANFVWSVVVAYYTLMMLHGGDS